MIYASVTQVLQPFADFSKIPPDVLARASERGSRVHDACANYARGLVNINIAPEVVGYFDSFRRWFDVMADEVLLAETRLVDEGFLFHGEPDLIIKSKTEGVILIDNKTPVQLVKTWRLQCAGYVNLATKNGMKPDHTGSLRLHPDGGIAKLDYYENSLTDFNYFLQALNLWRLFNTK